MGGRGQKSQKWVTSFMDGPILEICTRINLLVVLWQKITYYRYHQLQTKGYWKTWRSTQTSLANHSPLCQSRGHWMDQSEFVLQLWKQRGSQCLYLHPHIQLKHLCNTNELKILFTNYLLKKVYTYVNKKCITNSLPPTLIRLVSLINLCSNVPLSFVYNLNNK